MNPQRHEEESPREDERIESLSSDIADVVRRADPAERAELREYAAELVREETETAPTPARPRSRRGATAGLCVLLFAAGFVLLFLIPPVGTVVLLCAVAVLVVAVLRGIFVASAEGVQSALSRSTSDSIGPSGVPPPERRSDGSVRATTQPVPAAEPRGESPTGDRSETSEPRRTTDAG